MANQLGDIHMIIYDLDGTLVDTLDDLRAAVNVILSDAQRPLISRETVRLYIGDGLDTFLQRALKTKDAHLVAAARKRFHDYYTEHLSVHSRVYEGVAELLNRMQQRIQVILTNKPQPYALELLEDLGLTDHFRMIVGGRDDLRLKPAADGILYLLREFNIQPRHALMVGDSDNDILAGKAAGVRTCAVTYGFRERRLLAMHKPDIIVDTPGQLGTMLSS